MAPQPLAGMIRYEAVISGCDGPETTWLDSIDGTIDPVISITIDTGLNSYNIPIKAGVKIELRILDYDH